MKPTQSPAVATHTPTPWSIENDTDIIATDGGFVATSHDPRSDIGTATEYADAAFIVRACNNHAQLVAALGEAWKKMSEAEGVLDNIARRHATGDASRDFDLVESSASEADEARSALRCAIDPIRAALANLEK